jgi:hypothetical protein
MSKLKVFVSLFFLIETGAILSAPNTLNTMKNHLIIYHIDFNSVSLHADYVKTILKRASEMGYNAILWEIEDDIKWEICPEASSRDAFSKEEFQEILDYSRQLGLEPIPLLQTIGHAEYVLMNEKYSTFREDPTRYDCYCTSKVEVRRFLKSWINEYLDLFGEIRYFHLGGDEANVFATCPVCSKSAREIGKNKLYAEYLIEIASTLFEKGIKPGIWCDMILKYPKDLEVVPKDFIIWDWNYWDGDKIPQRVMVWNKMKRLSKDEMSLTDFETLPEILDANGDLKPFYTVDILKKSGFDVILCSSSRSYGDAVFAGRHEIHAPNIIGAAKKTVEAELLGTCVTSWAVRIHNHETQWPWFYLAPLTIRNHTLTTDQLYSLCSDYFFGIKSNEIFEAFSLIGFPFPFADQLSTGIMWTGMKDSKPVPKNYIPNLIKKWKSENSNQWKENEKIIQGAPGKINQGILLLNSFILKANNGFEILHAWSKSGDHQYWRAVIANNIVSMEKGEYANTNKQLTNLLVKLEADYLNWAKLWMTPYSAKQNTGLIFDAFTDYFSTKN